MRNGTQKALYTIAPSMTTYHDCMNLASGSMMSMASLSSCCGRKAAVKILRSAIGQSRQMRWVGRGSELLCGVPGRSHKAERASKCMLSWKIVGSLNDDSAFSSWNGDAGAT